MSYLPLRDVTPEFPSEEAFCEMYGREEQERLDFEPRPGKSVTGLLVAMAMTEGGLVVIGIALEGR